MPWDAERERERERDSAAPVAIRGCIWAKNGKHGRSAVSFAAALTLRTRPRRHRPRGRIRRGHEGYRAMPRGHSCHGAQSSQPCSCASVRARRACQRTETFAAAADLTRGHRPRGRIRRGHEGYRAMPRGHSCHGMRELPADHYGYGLRRAHSHAAARV
jgi:hypothetical protein